MSTYSVNATDVDDIVATVKFAKEYNLMFRIKNVSKASCFLRAMIDIMR
jgi:hypothetical protein